MEKLVKYIISCPNAKLDELHKNLGKEREFLEKNIPQAEEALIHLDFEEHSLGVLHLLSAVCEKIPDRYHCYVHAFLKRLELASSIQQYVSWYSVHHNKSNWIQGNVLEVVYSN
jgi:hypothetical protein